VPRAKKGSRKPGFEDALARLEKIVKDLEEGDLKLEESLRLFEEGVGLTRLCASRLDEAQRRIDLLTRGAQGELKLVPFENDDAEPSEGGDREER
jgi:exodeoxyribonuclease VII small subunit